MTLERGTILIEVLFAIGLFLLLMVIVNQTMADYRAAIEKSALVSTERVKRENERVQNLSPRFLQLSSSLTPLLFISIK